MVYFINEQCQKNCLEVCGWLGSFSIITAYICITLESDNLLFIDIKVKELKHQLPETSF